MLNKEKIEGCIERSKLNFGHEFNIAAKEFMAGFLVLVETIQSSKYYTFLCEHTKLLKT